MPWHQHLEHWNMPVKEPQGIKLFLHCRLVPINAGTWSLDPWDCKSFVLKTGFHYDQVPFQAGLVCISMQTVQCLCHGTRSRQKYALMFFVYLYIICNVFVMNKHLISPLVGWRWQADVRSPATEIHCTCSGAITARSRRGTVET